MWIASLSPTLASTYLAEAGLSIAPEELQIECREDRWVVHLPDTKLCWFAMTKTGYQRLTTERRVLKLLAERCSFAAPRLCFESPDGLFDVRSKVPGVVQPREMVERLKQRPDLAAQTGEAIAQILIEQHTQITATDVTDWLPHCPSWPLGTDEILTQIPQVVDDLELLRSIEALLIDYEAQQAQDSTPVLAHTDIGFHNLAFDPDSFRVNGIFDYGEAVWGDRHYDFRYLLFEKGHTSLLDAVLETYQAAVGISLSRKSIALHNAVCAFSYLAYRRGTAAEATSCGRTLAQDLDWCWWAIGVYQSI